MLLGLLWFFLYKKRDVLGQPKNHDQNCHSNLHHVYPRSRIPRKYRAKLLGNWIVIRVPIRTHNYFHTIFGNRTPEEQIRHLRKMCDENGILDGLIYNIFKLCFDEIFGGRRNFTEMVEVFKQWDLPEETKARSSEKLARVRRILNDEIGGGIRIRRFKLN
ncbi:hypothetical protein A2608_02420 [Candidatus Azambacteria bacterium RIFOXYD1_FULL_44_10]|nr:MAG: hypothetical protein A2608_02420 [Candidatus Azambacteria bacterium RIFOXYD1_FULL_44_10]